MRTQRRHWQSPADGKSHARSFPGEPALIPPSCSESNWAEGLWEKLTKWSHKATKSPWYGRVYGCDDRMHRTSGTRSRVRSKNYGSWITHIIKMLGCHEESARGARSVLYMLMWPVGDEVLEAFLHDRCLDATRSERDQFESWISTWFACLASALAYMYDQQILHEDIKPTNIIHRNGAIYFTDFSSSRKRKSHIETSTTSEAIAIRLYAAPEAFFKGDTVTRHGSKTDVFALGVVFVEMLSVGVGASVAELREQLFGDADLQPYHTVTNQILVWFAGKKGTTLSEEILVLQEMLASARNERPNALGVLRTLGQNHLLHPATSCECLKVPRTSCPSGEEGLLLSPPSIDANAFLEGLLHHPKTSANQLRLAEELGWQIGLQKFSWTVESSSESNNALASDWLGPNRVAVQRGRLFCWRGQPGRHQICEWFPTVFRVPQSSTCRPIIWCSRNLLRWKCGKNRATSYASLGDFIERLPLYAAPRPSERPS